jgi:5-methylcytosine-specific restriction endonuclease McrA
MSDFIQTSPTLDAYWRAIILFGRNSASYKFALAKSLIDLSQTGKSIITLEEFAIPFSRYITEHLQLSDRQGTSASSSFLQVCRDYNQGRLSQEDLLENTLRLGFVNVIDAFHIVNQAEIPIRFFTDERKTSAGISVTDEFFQLIESFQSQNLPFEVDARWRLVETAWALNMSPQLLSVKYDEELNSLYIFDNENRRIDVTSSKDALNGYQKGKCFYCFTDIAIDPTSGFAGDVDHFLPHSLIFTPSFPAEININGIWNLVLTCRECNRGPSGKFARIPEIRFLERLHRRNNYLIDSHHPLRETLMSQTGATQADRIAFLNNVDHHAIQALIHRWRPANELPSTF